MGEDPFEGNWRQYLDPDDDGLTDEEGYEEEVVDSCGKSV